MTPTRVAVVGCGVIGTGWAAHFLRAGLDVAVWDPDPAARARLRSSVEALWPVMVELGLAANASPDRLRLARSLAEATEGVQVVQECGPEDLAGKILLFAELDAATEADVLLLSSTSGLTMSEIQVRCQHPERTVTGHPFNPPYAIPLVEVTGGQRTDPDMVARAIDFYISTGKVPLQLNRELPGHVANRLQEALWREAMHMIAVGEASVEQIDLAITHGLGLRWAVFGPCLTFHLGGGPGGMSRFLDHFGSTHDEPWTRLTAPEMTSELRERLVSGCEQEAAGRSYSDLVGTRDNAIAAILRALGRGLGDG